MKNNTRILLPDDAFNCFWSPSLIFDNNKDGKHFSLSVPNTLMTVYSNRTVLKASRYRNFALTFPIIISFIGQFVGLISTEITSLFPGSDFTIIVVLPRKINLITKLFQFLDTYYQFIIFSISLGNLLSLCLAIST